MVSKINILILIFTCFGLFTGCNGCSHSKYPLYVDNQSSYDIEVFFNNDSLYRAVYPDTSITSFKPGYIINIPSGVKEVLEESSNWESVFEVSVPNDTVSIVILHSDTLAKYPWDTIRRQYNILKRFDVSLDYLERNDFTIIYH